MPASQSFPLCCGALTWSGFYKQTEKEVIAEIEHIENSTKRYGMSILILSYYNKYYAPVLDKRKGWEKFCHGATNPVHSNETILFGYAYSATTPPKKKKVLTKRKSLFGLTRKVR